jgi:hypothetical protein
MAQEKKNQPSPEKGGQQTQKANYTVPQGFTHGMVGDPDPRFQLEGSYSDALNIRLTNDKGDSFTVENIEGNSQFIDLGELQKQLNTQDKGILGKTTTGSSTVFSEIYWDPTNHDVNGEEVGSNYPVAGAYPFTDLGSAYSGGPNIDLSNRASIVGYTAYADTIFLIIVARFEWANDDGTMVQEVANRTIFLSIKFNDELQVTKVIDHAICYSNEGGNYPDLNMDIDNQCRVEHMVENSCISRVYWTDNKNQLRTVNLGAGGKNHLSKEELDITPLMSPSQPTLKSTTHGSLPVGVYQYSFKYVSANGGETTFSPLSNLYHVSDQSFSSTLTYGGGPPGKIGVQGFTITVADLDQDFKFIELYALMYEQQNLPPRVSLVAKKGIEGRSSVDFSHTTWFNQIQDGLEDVLIESNTWDVCKDIAIKDNILFAANLKSKKNWISEKEWNVKVARHRIYDGEGILTTNDSAVNHYKDGSLVSPTGQTDRNGFTIKHGRLLQPSEHEECAFDGTINTPMWTTLLENQRHSTSSAASNDESKNRTGRIKQRLEYRYLPDLMTPGGESFNYGDNTSGGCRVTFGVKERAADQTQNTSTSPYISATIPGEEMQTDFAGSIGYNAGGQPETKFKTSMSLGGSMDPHAAGDKRGYQRGDVYRFGVQTYDLTGAPGNVLWIGDIQTPEQHDVLRMIDLDQNSYTPVRPTSTNIPSGYSSLISQNNIVRHKNVMDFRLSYVYGHTVPKADVEWFSARIGESTQNLDAYVKHTGMQDSHLPNNGASEATPTVEGLRKAVPYYAYGTTHDDTHYLMDLYVNFEFIIPRDIAAKISGFRVVRAERKEDDRRVVQQGLLNQTMQYGTADGDLEVGYDSNKFSAADNASLGDEPVFVNAFNKQDPTKVEQPEFNTYLNGYLGLAENSNLAYYNNSATDGVLTSGNITGKIGSWPETEDSKRHQTGGNGPGSGHGYWGDPGSSGGAILHNYAGPGAYGKHRRHSSYFGTYPKYYSGYSDGTQNAWGNNQISSSIYTLDSPDSAFGIRPYQYREGDFLRIDCSMKLTDKDRYTDSAKSWGVGQPFKFYSHCRNNANFASLDAHGTGTRASQLIWEPLSFDKTDIDSISFCTKRHIDEDYSVLIGKYYCYDPYFGIGMEIDGGMFAAMAYVGSGGIRPRNDFGWSLPLTTAKEIGDGEIVSSSFFKKSKRVDDNQIYGFSNNTLGYYKSAWERDNSTYGGFSAFGAVTLGTHSIAAIKDYSAATGGADATTWPDDESNADDFTYDTVSTMQMGLRTILLEVDNWAATAKRTGDSTGEGSYFNNNIIARPGHRFHSWFAPVNLSAIYEGGSWLTYYLTGTGSGSFSHQPSSNNNFNSYTEVIHSSALLTNYSGDYRTSKDITKGGVAYRYGSYKRSLIPFKYLCSIVRRVVPYGGYGKEAIESTRYIPCGNFHAVDDKGWNGSTDPAQPIAHVSQVFGGDTFVNLYSHQKTSSPYMKKSASRWQVFPVESYVNTDMRSGLTLNSGDTEMGKDINQPPFSNSWLYNPVFSQENNIKSGLMIDENVTCDALDLPYEIAYSNTKISGDPEDAFRQFPINQFHDMEAKYGEINRIINFKNEIYILQDKGFAKLLVNPISMLKDETGNSLYTGTGETVENHIYISTKHGTTHRFSVAASEHALYFADSNYGRLFKYDTEKLVSLGDSFGQRNYLREIMKEWKNVATAKDSGVWKADLKGDLDNITKSGRNYIGDNPLKFVGITSIFDHENKELLITFHNSTFNTGYDRNIFANPYTHHQMGSSSNGQQIGISETLVFNEGINAFTSRYSVAPPSWIAGGSGSFLVTPENEISVRSIMNIRKGSAYYDHLPYNIFGSYDSDYYKQYRSNPLSLWLWNKHKDNLKTNFFGKMDDARRKVSDTDAHAFTSPIDGNNYHSAVTTHEGRKPYAEESYIEKVISEMPQLSKVYDSVKIPMVSDNEFSSLEFASENSNPHKTNINYRWNFEDTHHGWSWHDGSGYVEPTINSVTSTNESTVVVSGIVHPVDTDDGKYFFFTVPEWNSLAGNTSWSSNVFNVKQYRDGILIWQGDVYAWDNADGVHGSRVLGSAADQWEVGDKIKGGNSSGTITLTATADNPMFRSPLHEDKLNLDGEFNNIVRVRIKRISGTSWQGALFWTGTSKHGEHQRLVDNNDRRQVVNEPSNMSSEFVTLEWDMKDTPSWNDCIIERLRFDFSWGTSTFEIDWIEIGSNTRAKHRNGMLKIPLRNETSQNRLRGTWAKVKYKAKTTNKFNIFAIMAKYRKTFR